VILIFSTLAMLSAAGTLRWFLHNAVLRLKHTEVPDNAETRLETSHTQHLCPSLTVCYTLDRHSTIHVEKLVHSKFQYDEVADTFKWKHNAVIINRTYAYAFSKIASKLFIYKYIT
jgi:hypothetical protein